MKHYDVVIIGSGPGGLCLARELKDHHYKILVLDKKENASDVQYNTSGSFLDKKEWKIPDDCFHPITKTYFASKNEHIIKKGIASIINRKRLLEFLENEAAKNPHFTASYQSAVVDSVIDDNGVHEVTYRKGNKKITVNATIFADCSGVSAILGKKMSIAPAETVKAVGCEYLVPLKTEPHTADLFVGSDFRGGYGWIFPLTEKTAIVGWGSLLPETFPEVETHLRDMWKIPRVAERCTFHVLKKDVAVFRTGKPLQQFHAKNCVIIGDTALQGNPLVGEGIRFVMDASRMAGQAIHTALEKNDVSLLKLYTKAWTKKYYRSYMLAYHLQKRIMNASKDNKKMDFGIRRLQKLSDKDFLRLLSADLDLLFLLRIGGVSVLKTLF